MNSYSMYSIIVPSYNRSGEIREMLQSLLLLDFPVTRFEVIIADDGSTDDTADLVGQFAAGAGFPLRLLRQANCGPGAARNLGLESARGDFFIFIDSDCTVAPHWLSAIDRGLAEQHADAFGGPDSYRADFPPLLKAINYSMTSFITTGGIRGHRKKGLGKYYPRSFNMGLSRAVYQQIGGFGGLRHGQDIEYSHRIIKSGARVVLIADAPVYHKRRTSLKKFFRQVYNWGVARINLYKMDPKMLEPVHALPAMATLVFLLALAGTLFVAPLRLWLLPLFAAGGLVVLASGVHAAWQYRDMRQLLLVPLVMPIQVLGYGLGFLVAYVGRVVFGFTEFSGFRKRYYD